MATWAKRIEELWQTVDRSSPAEAMATPRELVDERPEHGPEALYEWASIHDFLGREDEAIPLYRAALEAGLDGEARRGNRAVGQLIARRR